jgi:hypothetical protein
MITIGCDPEVFLVGSNDACFPVQALPDDKFIKGDKYNPFMINDYAGILRDNAAVEFNITPSSEFDDFDHKIEDTLHYIAGLSRVSRRSSYTFSWRQLEDHPETMEFGCIPDYNAYTGRPNTSPHAGDTGFRTCGGHVHIGFDGEKSYERQRNVVLACDYLLGIPSIVEDVGGIQRRQLYGKAGCHRPKPYGVEYRTLSNYWIFSSGQRKAVYNRAVLAAQFADGIELLRSVVRPGMIRETINDGNIRQAEEIINLLDKEGLYVPIT